MLENAEESKLIKTSTTPTLNNDEAGDVQIHLDTNEESRSQNPNAPAYPNLKTTDEALFNPKKTENEVPP